MVFAGDGEVAVEGSAFFSGRFSGGRAGSGAVYTERLFMVDKRSSTLDTFKTIGYSCVSEAAALFGMASTFIMAS